jgi:hypothetical protein
MKAIFGVGAFLVVVALFVFGVFVTLAGIGFVGQGAASEGNIEIIYNQVAKITGLNGHTLVLVMGVIMVLVATFFSLKAYDMAKGEWLQDRKQGKEPENLLWTTIKHFNPTGL